MKAGGADAAKSVFHAVELIVGDSFVGLVGGKEMGHHAFEAQWRIAVKAREKRRERFRIGSLAAHAGVDFKMN